MDLFVAGAFDVPQGRTANAVLLNGDAGFSLDTSHPLATVSDVDAALWGDYDNDGLTDVYLCRRSANQLWRQTMPTRWADVTAATHAAGPGGDTGDGALVDADPVGDLDLFLVRTDGPNELLNNTGDGTFRAMATQAGIAGDGRPLFSNQGEQHEDRRRHGIGLARREEMIAAFDHTPRCETRPL